MAWFFFQDSPKIDRQDDKIGWSTAQTISNTPFQESTPVSVVCQALVLKASRTKHYMADEKYLYSALYYPRAVAKVRMPLGIPSGLVLKIRDMSNGS